MNILYLVHRIPHPPDKGDKLRAFRQLEYLSRRHNVWCACFVDRKSDLNQIEPLRAICREVLGIRLRRPWAVVRGLGRLLLGGSITEGFYADRRMRRGLKHWGDQIRFDVVVAFSSGMANGALSVPAGRKVLDFCDLDSEKWLEYGRRGPYLLRSLYRWEGRRLANAERRWLRAFDASMVVSEGEAAVAAGFEGADRLFVVGNGAPPAASQEFKPPVARNDPSTPTIGFVGVMNYLPNADAVRWFVRHCWPRIRCTYPKARFRIVGPAPTRGVRRLEREPGVQVVGYVRDVAAELADFDVSVAPLRMGRGLPNKVIEAMAAGKPVVLSGLAARNVGGRSGHHFLVADTPSEFARAVVRMLNRPSWSRRLAEAGQTFVREGFDWARVLSRLEWVVTGAGPVRSACGETAKTVSTGEEGFTLRTHASGVAGPAVPVNNQSA